METKEDKQFKKIKEFCEKNNIAVFALDKETGMTVSYCKNNNDRILLLNLAQIEEKYIDKRNELSADTHFNGDKKCYKK